MKGFKWLRWSFTCLWQSSAGDFSAFQMACVHPCWHATNTHDNDDDLDGPMIWYVWIWHEMRWFDITWYAVMTPIGAHKVHKTVDQKRSCSMYVTISSHGSWLCHSWSAKTMRGKPHGSHVTTPLVTQVHHSVVSTTWASQHSAPSKWRTSAQWQQNRMGFWVAWVPCWCYLMLHDESLP